MGIFNKKQEEKDDVQAAAPVAEKAVVVKKAETPVAKKAEKAEKKDALKGTTTEAYRIIIKPLITEKASFLSTTGKYVFAVDPKANKVEIKKAIRSIYNVEPVDVNVSNYDGKMVRGRHKMGQKKSWKKAIVTLKSGQTIELYHGV